MFKSRQICSLVLDVADNAQDVGEGHADDDIGVDQVDRGEVLHVFAPETDSDGSESNPDPYEAQPVEVDASDDDGADDNDGSGVVQLDGHGHRIRVHVGLCDTGASWRPCR